MIDIDSVKVMSAREQAAPELGEKDPRFIKVNDEEGAREIAEKAGTTGKPPFFPDIMQAMDGMTAYRDELLISKAQLDEKRVHELAVSLMDAVKNAIQYYTNKIVPVDESVNIYETAIVAVAMKLTYRTLEEGFLKGEFGWHEKEFFERVSHYASAMTSYAYHREERGKDGDPTGDVEKKS